MKKFIAILVIVTIPCLCLIADAETEKTYRTITNPNLSFKEIIEKGEYDWVHKDINQDTFPENEVKSDEMVFQAIKPDDYKTRKEILITIPHPAGIRDLLEFGASHPEVQKDCRIIAIGQSAPGQFGSIIYPLLFSLNGKRQLGVYTHFQENTFDNDLCFLEVVEKKIE